MTFQEYCISKKIDGALFKKSEQHLFQELENLFVQMHPDSFTSQKKFLINNLRRKFKWTEVDTGAIKSTSDKPKLKPVIGKKASSEQSIKPNVLIPKPKTNSSAEAKPKIPKPKTATPNPVIPGVNKKENTSSGPSSLKPKIPSTSQKKSLALKPKIKPKNKD